MKKIFYLLTILISLESANAFAQSQVAKYFPVKAEKVDKMIRQKNLILLDVRTPEEVAQGALPGAINYNFESPDFKEQIAVLPKNVPYLVYCRSAKRSAKAVEIMKDLGFTRIYEMEGGMVAYDAAKKIE